MLGYASSSSQSRPHTTATQSLQPRLAPFGQGDPSHAGPKYPTNSHKREVSEQGTCSATEGSGRGMEVKKRSLVG